jgi:hypothetical protein
VFDGVVQTLAKELSVTLLPVHLPTNSMGFRHGFIVGDVPKRKPSCHPPQTITRDLIVPRGYITTACPTRKHNSIPNTDGLGDGGGVVIDSYFLQNLILKNSLGWSIVGCMPPSTARGKLHLQPTPPIEDPVPAPVEQTPQILEGDPEQPSPVLAPSPESAPEPVPVVASVATAVLLDGPLTVRDEILRRTSELNRMREEAHTTTVREIHERIELLTSLGYDYELREVGFAPVSPVTNASPVPPKTVKKLTRPSPAKAPAKSAALPAGARGKAKNGKLLAGYNASKHCPICGVLGHDRRTHRLHPSKFTVKELTAMGLAPR